MALISILIIIIKEIFIWYSFAQGNLLGCLPGELLSMRGKALSGWEIIEVMDGSLQAVAARWRDLHQRWYQILQIRAVIYGQSI